MGTPGGILSSHIGMCNGPGVQPQLEEGPTGGWVREQVGEAGNHKIGRPSC